jgi:hypothetical protein
VESEEGEQILRNLVPAIESMLSQSQFISIEEPDD